MNQAFNDLTPEQKYSKDAPFNDPMVRCDKCQELLFVVSLKHLGACTRCGNTRVGNVRVLNEEEMSKLQGFVNEGKLDPDWLSLFLPHEAKQPTEQDFLNEARGQQ